MDNCLVARDRALKFIIKGGKRSNRTLTGVFAEQPSFVDLRIVGVRLVNQTLTPALEFRYHDQALFQTSADKLRQS